ncbi:hypothetical protein MTO96_001138 [Rhipicephalus appendiculatus]
MRAVSFRELPPAPASNGSRRPLYRKSARTVAIPANTASKTSPERMNNYVIMKNIGEGTYGVVYKEKCQVNNKIVAMKKVRVEGEEEGVPATTIREYITMDLRKHLDTLPENKTLDGAFVKKYLREIVDAILFCHQRRVLQRDLKPANLLIDDNGDIKVADFGLGRAFTLPVRAFTHGVPTLWYRAPEILMGAGRYSTAVDVWSIGCISFELLSSKVLFRGDSEIDQLFRIFRVPGTPTVHTWPEVTQLPNFKQSFPKWRKNIVAELLPQADSEAVDLLLKMLIYSPRERISAKGAAAQAYTWPDRVIPSRRPTQLKREGNETALATRT